MSSSTPSVLFVRVPIRHLAPEALEKLSKDKKLSLSREDMVAVQEYFVEKDREPTDVELEVIAQTWSEHCKHRILDRRSSTPSTAKPKRLTACLRATSGLRQNGSWRRSQDLC